MDDLTAVDHAAMHLDHGSDEFGWHVFNAVGHGCAQRSPFWHASVSLCSAHCWRAIADSERVASGGGCRVAIRIDIWEWFQSGTMPDHGLTDLSDDAAQHRFFKKQSGLVGY